MAKSRARFLAELINTDGRVKKEKSQLTGGDNTIDLDSLPTIPNSKLQNSSISIAGHSTALGGSVSLNTGDISEHTDYLYYTNARARSAISITDSGGDGSLSFNSTTGVITYTGPSAAEVRAHITASTGISITDGAISTASIPNASLTNSSVTINSNSLSLGGTLTLDTDDVGEGSTNLYYTNARARGAISVTGAGSYNSTTGVITVTGGVTSVNTQTGAVVLDTDDVGEGSTNLYYTDARVGSYLSTNSYATQSYVGTQIANLVDSAPGTLNTLNELAAALGDDANFSTTVTNSIATKLPSSSYTAADVLTKIKTVDGASSGLDADLLDGLHGTSYLRSDAADTATGAIEISTGTTQPLKLTTSSSGPWAIELYRSDTANSSKVFNSGSAWYFQHNINIAGYTNVHFGNDGSGSGLDADLLDGLHGSSYMRSTGMADNADTYMNFRVIRNNNSSSSNDGMYIGYANSGSGHTRLFGGGATSGGLYIRGSGANDLTYGNNTGTIWHSANDGSGTGLDADLLDGIQAASFLRSDTSDTATQINSPIFSGNISTSGDGQNNYPFRLTNDYNSYMTAVAGNTWGLFWAGNSGARYGTNGNGGPGNIWSNSGNPNEFVFVGGDSSAWSVQGSSGDTWQKGTARSNAQGVFWGASNDGSGSGLDADTLDGIDSGSFLRSDASDSASGSYTFTNSYNSFGNSTGSVSNDGSWNARVNIAGSSHARFDVKSVSDGIITTMYSHTGQGIGRVGTMSNHPVGIMANGSYWLEVGTTGHTKITYNGTTSTPSYTNGQLEVYTSGNYYPAIGFHRGGYSATTLYEYDGELYVNAWTARNQTGKLVSFGNDGSGSGLDADLLDGKQGASYTNYKGVTSGNWDSIFTSSGDTTGIYEVQNITSGSHSNYPTGVYTYGGVFAWQLANHTFKLYSSHTGDLVFQSGWQNDEYSGWRRILNTSYYGDAWRASTDGSGSGLDADLLDGLQLCSSTTNNQVNTVVRTDGNGYANFGWINTISGDSGLGNDVARIYCSYDNYIRYLGKSDFKVLMGLSKDTYDRRDYTTDANYHTGVNAHGAYNMNDLFNRGSGFIDVWSSPTGKPPTGSHYNGFQALHYSASTTYHHGMQMVMDAGNPSYTYLRGWWANGGSGYAWQRIWTDGNDGSGSGLDADTLDGYNTSTSATANTVVVREASGHIYGNYILGSYFNASSGNSENPTIGQIWTQNTGDNYLRKSTPAHFRNQMMANGLVGGTSGKGTTNFAFGSTANSNSGFYDVYNNGTPTGTWYSMVNMAHYGGNHGHQIAGSFYSHHLYHRYNSNTTLGSWSRIWSNECDGSGSGLDADLLDGYEGSNYIGYNGNSYYQVNNWIQLNGGYGLYCPTINGAHLLPNTATSYATWRTIGSRGGYDGIMFDSGGNMAIMFDSGGNGGFYQEGGAGWAQYFNVNTSCTGFGTSSTSSSYEIYVSGAIYATNNIVAYSDARIKENVVTIDNALSIVEEMRGVYYNKIDDPEKKTQIGFIAQEVNAIEGAKPLVTYAEDVDQYGVSYGNTTALLVEAIKELSQQVKDLKKELEELKNG